MTALPAMRRRAWCRRREAVPAGGRGDPRGVRGPAARRHPAARGRPRARGKPGAKPPRAGEVKTLVGESPLEAVDSIEIKPLLVGEVVKVTIRGNEFKLEAGAGANAEGVVEAFEQRRGAAV